MSRAGSRRRASGCADTEWRGARLIAAFEGRFRAQLAAPPADRIGVPCLAGKRARLSFVALAPDRPPEAGGHYPKGGVTNVLAHIREQ